MKKNVFSLLSVFFLLFLLSETVYGVSQEEIRYSVSIVGAIPNAGVYRIPPFTRVSELYQRAVVMADSLEINETFQPSLRNVSLRRNGDKTILDLAKFYHLGDINNNPYLEDGDVIHVPVLEHEVSIEGEINKPGKYEILPSSTLSEMIDFSYGFTPDAELQEIYIIRYINDEPVVLKHNFVHQEKEFLLENQDQIIVHKKVELRNNEDYIHIRGQVMYPGMYPYQEGKTSLLSIIELAGGVLEFADLEHAYVQRYIDKGVLNREKTRLQEVPYTEMNHTEKEFLKSAWRYSTNTIQIDLEQLLQTKDKKYDVELKKNDIIYIPDKTKTIIVTGNVKHPGQFTYIPNTTYDEYIEKAGGYSWNVDKRNIRLIRFGSGEWLKPMEETILMPGDMLIVPEKKVYDVWDLSKDALSVLVQFATLVVLINNLSAN